jgi:SAM-dependent methyltransferase
MQRVRVPERMDDPTLDPSEHARALAGLATLNAVARSHAIVLPEVLRAARRAPGRPLRVLDVACGSADGPVRIDRAARRAGVRIEWTFCDASDFALGSAMERARAAGTVARAVRRDAVAEDLPAGHDLVTCSLFLHHLDRPDVVGVLRRLGAAARAGAVSDLDRGAYGLSLAWIASRALSRSPVVHFDATASVRAAHARGEALAMAQAAGLPGAGVRGAWPARWLLTWGDR